MAFKEVSSLESETTIAMGGTNKKTGKANPTKIEGFYLGKREVQDRKKKSGVSSIYYLQTAKGNVGVWGKTDLDRKMAEVSKGAMIRVTQSGTRETPNGDMYLFKVEVDLDNTIDADNLPHDQFLADGGEQEGNESYADANETEDEEEETGVDEEEQALDEAPARRAAPPKTAARAPDAARQAKVQALLNGSRKAAS